MIYLSPVPENPITTRITTRIGDPEKSQLGSRARIEFQDRIEDHSHFVWTGSKGGQTSRDWLAENMFLKDFGVAGLCMEVTGSERIEQYFSCVENQVNKSLFCFLRHWCSKKCDDGVDSAAATADAKHTNGVVLVVRTSVHRKHPKLRQKGPLWDDSFGMIHCLTLADKKYSTNTIDRLPTVSYTRLLNAIWMITTSYYV